MARSLNIVMNMMKKQNKKRIILPVMKETIFISLTKDNFQTEVLESKQPVLVKIGADWLGTCDIMAPILEELHKEYKEKVKFSSVDVDSSKELADRFGMAKLPAFIFFKDGQTVGHIIGAAPKVNFINIFKSLL